MSYWLIVSDDQGRTDDGYRLSFAASSETLRAVAAVIDAERQCCQAKVTPPSVR